MKHTFLTHARRSMPSLLLALLAVVVGSYSHALDEYKDWDIACDNTKHCEAAGTESEEAFDGDTAHAVALWIGRDAGPNTPVLGTLTLSDRSYAAASQASVVVGGKRFTLNVAPNGDLDPAPLKVLLAAMLNENEARISTAGQTWVLSLAGFKAAALKMDEMQGRLFTPGALVRKGNKPESTVPPPLPAPVVHAVPFQPNRKGDDALAGPVLAAVADRDCFDNLPDDQGPQISVVRVSSTQVIVERECSRAAYQSEPTLWLANDKPPYSPKEVEFADARPANTSGAGQYNFELDAKSGHADSMMKGRGLNDCNESEEWAWTGRRFVVTQAWTAPQCRGIPGGVSLRVWVSAEK